MTPKQQEKVFAAANDTVRILGHAHDDWVVEVVFRFIPRLPAATPKCALLPDLQPLKNYDCDKIRLPLHTMADSEAHRSAVQVFLFLITIDLNKLETKPNILIRKQYQLLTK